MTPGFYVDISHDDYHADNLLAWPTLNNSVAKVMLDQSPKHGWTAHPRLNPNHRPEHNGAMDLGSAAHALLRGEDRIGWIEADDFRTKLAREARDKAHAEGRIPVLWKMRHALYAMNKALFEQLRFYEQPYRLKAFQGGVFEGTAVWKEEEVWCRSRFDWVDPQGAEYIIDYKTTLGSASPEAWTRRVFSEGGDVQSGFYRRAAKAVLGWRDPQFIFVVQELTPPFAISVIGLSPAAQDYADRKAAEAIRLWQNCIRTDYWPAYPSKIARVDAPVWTQMEWDAREERERMNEGVLHQAYDWQAPT